MKIALDPYMLRSTPLLELPGVVANIGYEYIELSPREDFTPFFLHPRADDAGVKAFKKALDGAGVEAVPSVAATVAGCAAWTGADGRAPGMWPPREATHWANASRLTTSTAIGM